VFRIPGHGDVTVIGRVVQRVDLLLSYILQPSENYPNRVDKGEVNGHVHDPFHNVNPKVKVDFVAGVDMLGGVCQRHTPTYRPTLTCSAMAA
jgi:hypothetical protein